MSTTPGSATRRGASINRPKEGSDIWAGNPYPAGHPKNIEVAESMMREQRKKLNSRFAGSPGMKMRIADYERENVAFSAASPSRQSDSGASVKDEAKRNPPTTIPIAEFQSKSRCIIAIQGGATVWSGEENGTISIRNGFTGEVSMVLPMNTTQHAQEEDEEPKLLVDRMLALAGHVFVGFNDGTIKIYDSLVVTLVQESTSNKGSPVKHFLQLDNGLIVAGSENGKLTLFEDYNQELAETENIFFKEQSSASLDVNISAIAAAGESFIVGTPDGEVLCIDTTDLGAYLRFKIKDTRPPPEQPDLYVAKEPKGPEAEEGDAAAAAPAEAAPEEAAPAPEIAVLPPYVVGALLCANGILYVGMCTGGISIFRMTKYKSVNLIKEFQPFTTAITQIINDSRANRVWVASTEGKLYSFDGREDTDFAKRAEIDAAIAGHVVDVSMLCHMDAFRMWTLAANGINFTWWSEFDQAGSEMETVIENMQQIIDRDNEEIANWKEKVANVERQTELRKSHCFEALAGLSDNSFRQAIYWKWRKWMRLREHLRKRQAFSLSIASTFEFGLLREYYLQMMQYWQANRLARQKLAVSRNLLCTTRKGIQRVYWRKMVEYTAKEKAKMKCAQMAEALMCTSDLGLLRKYYKMYCSLNDRRKYRRKRIQISETLLMNSDLGMMRLYYFSIVRHRSEMLTVKKRMSLLDALHRNSELGLMRITYGKLMRNIRVQISKRQRERISLQLGNTTGYCLTAKYYFYWVSSASDIITERKKKEQEENLEILADLEAKYKLMEDRIDRQQAMKKKMEERDHLLREKQKRLSGVAYLESENRILEKKIADKRDLAQQDTSVRVQLVEAMGQLKNRALNFDTDYSLISKTADKAASQDRGPLRAFLTAHMELKRVVVSNMGEQPSRRHDPDADLTYSWGNTEHSVHAAVAKFPSFGHSQLVDAVKKMVITFDLMKAEDMDEIETDDEIVANAKSIIIMYDFIIEQKNKKKAPKSSSTRSGTAGKSGSISKGKASPSKAKGSPKKK